MSLLAGFFSINRRLSATAAAWLPSGFKHHLHTLYKYQVAEALNRRAGQVVIDVGGGKDCPFLPYLKQPQAHVIIALDCSEEQLRGNPDVERRVVGDAAGNGLPFRDRSADLVVSRSVVEHIHDNAAFFENCAHVLRPGGAVIHAFPGKFAPFAVLNRIIPNRLVRRLIPYLLPEWAEEGNYGFIAYYDHCSVAAVRKLLDRNRFHNIRYTLTYYQSEYFSFFFPLYCLMVVYDLLGWALGIRSLASGILVTAQQATQWSAEVAAGVETPRPASAFIERTPIAKRRMPAPS